MNAAADRVEHLRRLGRLDDAERIAREALAAEPQDGELLRALAAVLLHADRYAEGLAAAEAATAVSPDNERSHRLRALLLSHLGRHQEAVHAGYTAVTLAPEEPLAGTGYAKVLQRAGMLGAAAESARRVVSLDPLSADAHFLLADVTSDVGDLATARSAYEEVLRLDPQHAAARHNLALLDARAHRPGVALRGLVDAGAMDPSMPEVIRTVTAVLWQLSWRLRIGLAGAVIVTVVASDGPDTQNGTVRATASAVLLAACVLAWWTSRGMPRQTGAVVRAALRTDKALVGTYLAIAFCLLLYVTVAITGIAGIAGAVWVVLVLLGWITLGLRLVRRRARRRA